MGTRQPDIVELVTDAGTFDRFSRLSITNDILGMAEATFETGDEKAWPDIQRLLAPGTEVRVLLNGRLRMRGRAEVLDAPSSASGGTAAAITVRTKMSDARYASARPRVITKATTFKEFVLACYADIGITEDDFEWRALADVAMMTGKQKGGGDVVDFTPVKPDQAKVNPPETIFAAVDKHLRRFRAVHWDGADGKIVVGIPDDEQEPLYVLQSRVGPGISNMNNITDARRIRDWSEVAREVWIIGQTPGTDTAKLPLRGKAIDDEVAAAFARTGHFNRLVIIPRQQADDSLTADQHAQRELTQRRQRKDGWEISVDGLSYWNGTEQIPYAPNTTADLTVDVLGGASGSHLITRTQMDYGIDTGAVTRLTMVAKGLFLL